MPEVCTPDFLYLTGKRMRGGRKMTEDFVSICLFAYNQEKYIRAAVESCLSQTYSSCEIILSDDASTDKTFELMQECVKEYNGPHKIILNRNQTNLGLAAHYYYVFSELASSKWVMMAAGDDISMADRLEKIMKELATHPSATMGSCLADRIDSSGKIVRKFENHQSVREFKRGDFKSFLPLGATAVWRRDLITDFPVWRSVLEDAVLGFRAALLGDGIELQESLVQYRVDSGGVTSSENQWRERRFSHAERVQLLLRKVTLHWTRRTQAEEQHLEDIDCFFANNLLDAKRLRAKIKKRIQAAALLSQWDRISMGAQMRVVLLWLAVGDWGLAKYSFALMFPWLICFISKK